MFLQRAAVLIELVKGIERLMSIHWRKIEQPRDFNVTLADDDTLRLKLDTATLFGRYRS